MFFLVLFVFKENGAQITGDGLHEVRIIGCITAVLLVGIVVIGMEWEAKVRGQLSDVD
jgi:solute carrier family 12 sodium/potassium/chloride transporter 2